MPGYTGDFQVNAQSDVNSVLMGLRIDSMISTIPPTIPLAGDANGDGKVDINDLTLVLTNFGQSTGMSWTQGDFNSDAKVNVNDLTIVLTNFGRTSSTASRPCRNRRAWSCSGSAPSPCPRLSSEGEPYSSGLMGSRVRRLEPRK